MMKVGKDPIRSDQLPEGQEVIAPKSKGQFEEEMYG